MNRLYFTRIWRRERNAFRKGMKKWFVETLKSKERRKIIRTLWVKGKQVGLFEWEIDNYIRQIFGISLFSIDNYWGTIAVYETPTWILKEILRLYESGVERAGAIRFEIVQKFGIWVEPRVIYRFLHLMNPLRVLKIKERHDQALNDALEEVGHIEQDFILAFEERAEPGIYEDFAMKFKGISREKLIYFACLCGYVPAIIDACLIDKIAECAGLKPPELWRKFDRMVIEWCLTEERKL